MFRYLPLLLGAAVVSAGVCHPAVVAGEPPRPNIVLLLADDLGYGELGCQGNPQIPTPHIDSIASGGIRCTAGYVTAPYCAASRAGLLTGRYQTRFGFERNPIGAQNERPGVGLPASETTLAEYLREAGYATGLVGKWHLGGTAEFHPLRRGFDEFFGFLHEGHYYVPPPYHGVTTMLRRRALPDGGRGRWTSRDGRFVLSTHMGTGEPPYDADNPVYRGGQPVAEQEHLTDAFTREAVDFIRRHRERPFFLCVAFNAVHSPLQGAGRYMEKFADIEDVHRRIFAAMLAHLDDGIGEILSSLREAGVEGHTLVVFLSDNGGPTRELTSSNAPLRGGKGDVYEGGLRVPFLVRWPDTIPAGQTYDEPVLSLDVFATAAALAGRPAPRGRIDGVNLVPHLTGRTKVRPHAELFWRAGDRTAVRVGDWKLVRNPARGAAGAWELYDLAEDVGESQNLIARDPRRAEELRSVWERYNAEMTEPAW